MSQQYPYGVGLQNVGSYQVSGIPYLTGATAPVSSSTPVEIVFPDVTQRIIVSNTGLADLRIGFSANGVKNTNNYYVLHQHDGTTSSDYSKIDLRVKVSSIFLLSNTATPTSASVLAELTNIDTNLLAKSGPTGLPNWSGSVGVG
jgi:hypothetical protein